MESWIKRSRPRAGAVRALSLLATTAFLSGCSAIVLNPAGDVAMQQRNMVIIATVLMLLIIVPVMALTVLFAWRYRASNTEATYAPDWDHSTGLELVIWSAPLLIIICLGAVTWVGTHTLDPYRPLGRIDAAHKVAPGAQPLDVDVVALDWKWLFIYPQYGFATVNELAAPIGRPIQFHITSSSVMNSFFVPALAGQIYAMPGMETELAAVANRPGSFVGFSANYSGQGFSGMHFPFYAVSPQRFAQWTGEMRQGGVPLSRANYMKLDVPSEDVPPMHFASVDTTLYGRILNECVLPGKTCLADEMRRDMQNNAPTPANDTPGPQHNVVPQGAIFKSPAQKGSSPNVDAPANPHPPGDLAPGSPANRNMSALTPLPAILTGSTEPARS